MCYVVVKDFYSHGCVAYRTHIDKELNRLAPHSGIEIVVISKPAAYREYAPYSVETDQELKSAVFATRAGFCLQPYVTHVTDNHLDRPVVRLQKRQLLHALEGARKAQAVSMKL